MKNLTGSVYLAPEPWIAYVDQEIGGAEESWGRLLYRGHPEGLRPHSLWAHNVWTAPVLMEVSSISQAARALRSLGKLWAPFPQAFFRRMELIQKELPYFSGAPKPFPFDLPGGSGGLGGWTLLEEKLLLASAVTTSPFPNGELNFIENPEDPPSSAYLKLWEALTHLGIRPGPGDICFDAGCAPGGWTWVLAQLGAQVWSVDKAPLEKGLDSHPLVHYQKGDAFRIQASELPPLDWFFSDVICYPAKLYEWILGWLEASPQTAFVVTIKMQGEPDWEVLKKMAALPDSSLRHLSHNKHEVTWIRVPESLRQKSPQTARLFGG